MSPREELIGTDFSDYFTEPDKAKESYRLAFERGSVTDYPLTIRHQDGTLTEVLYNVAVHRDSGGKVLGLYAADVAESAEAALEWSAQTAGPGVIVLDHGLAGSLTGLTAAQRLRELAPLAKIILFTAHAELKALADAVDVAMIGQGRGVIVAHCVRGAAPPTWATAVSPVVAQAVRLSVYPCWRAHDGSAGGVGIHCAPHD